MKKDNVILSQLSEAMRMAEYDIFEYRRIGLILLDNIIENLLSYHVYQFAARDKLFKKISREEFIKQIESLNYFENITKYSKKYNIIKEKEKPLLDYCHKVRNNLYHRLFDDDRITDCCFLMLSEYLLKNIDRLLNKGYLIESKEFVHNRNIIFQIGGFEKKNDLYKKIDIICKKNPKPSEILSQILLDMLKAISEFKKEYADDDWEEFNLLIMKEYFNKVTYEEELKKNKKIEVQALVENFERNWRNTNENEIQKYIKKAKEIKNLDTCDSFEIFKSTFNRIEQIYTGISVAMD